jgi:hypothetical protein
MNIQTTGKKAIGVEDDVIRFEDFCGLKLPESYKIFLCNYNGCVFTDDFNVYVSEIELPGGREIHVNQLYGLEMVDSTIESIFRALEDNVGVLGPSSIAIGHDEFGNLICLNCDDDEVEWVLLEQRFPLDYTKIFSLKVSFNQFFRAIGELSLKEPISKKDG